jgi:hypothetical protein
MEIVLHFDNIVFICEGIEFSDLIECHLCKHFMNDKCPGGLLCSISPKLEKERYEYCNA